MPSSAANAALAELGRNVDTALSILLSCPENAWAADFVFSISKDPAGDVSMLTNPIPLASAVAGSVHGDSTMKRPLPSTVVNYVMIPAWSIGSITVGISVARVSNSSCPISGKTVVLYNMGRFVRDERSAETLMINTSLVDSALQLHPQDMHPSCAMIYLRHDSSTARYHFFASCNGDLFFNGKHAESVMYAESVLHYRICPVCFASPYMSCNCSIPFQVPKTCLDFSAFVPNSLSHMGKFTGTSIFVCKDQRNGHVSRNISHSQHLYDSVMDVELTKLLQDIAIQDRLLRANPCRGVMPGIVSDADGTEPPISSGIESNEIGPFLDLTDFDLDLKIDSSSRDITELYDVVGSVDNVLDDGGIFCPNSFLPTGSPAVEMTPEMQPLKSVRVTSEQPGRGRAYLAEGCVPLAPCPSSDIGIEGGTVEEIKDDFQSAKVLERQRKNRLAAARSNARRKLRMDTLKVDLQQGKDKICKLERRKQELLSINQHLKEQAANIWREQARSKEESS